MKKFDNNLESVPKNFLTLLAELSKKYKIEKIIVFGSRARGDFRQTSDIDIAVTLVNNSDANWPRFYDEIVNNDVTLLKVDLIRLDESLNQEFRSRIKSEGLEILPT